MYARKCSLQVVQVQQVDASSPFEKKYTSLGTLTINMRMIGDTDSTAKYCTGWCTTCGCKWAVCKKCVEWSESECVGSLHSVYICKWYAKTSTTLKWSFWFYQKYFWMYRVKLISFVSSKLRASFFERDQDGYFASVFLNQMSFRGRLRSRKDLRSYQYSWNRSRGTRQTTKSTSFTTCNCISTEGL